MRTKYSYAALGLLTLGLAVCIGSSQTTPKPLRSFLATSVTSSPQAGSPYLRISSVAHGVRPDGSWVEIRFFRSGSKEWNERGIRDFNSGIYTVVDDITKSLTTRAISANDKRLGAAVSCDGAPADKILGFEVTYTEEKSQITQNPQGDASAVVKRWLAPDLGCFVLRKETTWIRNSDGVLLVDSKSTPIAVTFQPVDELFEIPAAYAERTPGEVLRLRAKLFPNDFTAPGDTSGIDSSYQKAHDFLKQR